MQTNKPLYPLAKKIILGENYRETKLEAIETKFLEEAISFFKEIVKAKLNDKKIDEDWYRNEFLKNKNKKKKIALSSGLNIKSIYNTKGSQSKDVVLDFANEHYDILKNTINNLVEGTDFKIALELSFKDVQVKLNSQESLVVINSLTVLRSHIRGGAWSQLGKRIEIPLMKIFVELLNINEDNYYLGNEEDAPTRNRETDFFFTVDEEIIPVEIKLMGAGNPESADGAIARKAKIFFAYKLSKSNKENLEGLKIDFIELIDGEGIWKLSKVLDKYKIPHNKFEGGKKELKRKINKVVNNLIDESNNIS